MTEEAKSRYQRIIQDLGQIPTMPAVATKVMQIVNDPNSSAEDIGKFLSKDVALTSKVLRLANSAFYGIPRTISSVNSAVVILGLNTIRSLVLSASVIKVFPDKPGQPTFNRKAFWKHCFMVGIATRNLAIRYRKKKLVDSEMAFSAGLLHDIGKVILDQFAHEEYAPVLNAARAKGIPVVQAEMEMLGMTHADVSGMLVEKWQMPQELKIPLMFHHDPLNTRENADIAGLVHYANYLCHEEGKGCIENETFAPLQPEVVALLGLDVSEEELRAELAEQFKSAEAFFSLVEGG